MQCTLYALTLGGVEVVLLRRGVYHGIIHRFSPKVWIWTGDVLYGHWESGSDLDQGTRDTEEHKTQSAGLLDVHDRL